jgi:hypothetical protein
LPPSQRCADHGDHGSGANRPIEERHVAQHLELVECAKSGLTAIGAGKEKNRNVRPRRLRRKRVGEIVEPRIRERLLGEQNGACASGQLDTDIVHRVADLTADACAR